MKRAKLGDIFAFKTDAGFRIIILAYRVEKFGYFVRVLPGYYDAIPDNVLELAKGECSFIISTHINKLCSNGLLHYIGNLNTDSIPPMPDYDIDYTSYGDTGEFEVCEFSCPQNSFDFKGKPDGTGLPRRFKKLNLINGSVDPIWFIYLLVVGFDTKHWELFAPGEKTYSEFYSKYRPLFK